MLAGEQNYNIDLLGPSHLDRQWQSRHNTQFCAENFLIDWQQKKAVCPAGKINSSWSDARTDTSKEVIKIKFSTKDCQMCPLRADCIQSKRVRRALIILPEVQYEREAKDSGKRENPGISKGIPAAFRD